MRQLRQLHQIQHQEQLSLQTKTMSPTAIGFAPSKKKQRLICITSETAKGGGKDGAGDLDIQMKESGCLLKPFLSDELLQGHVNNNLNNSHGRNIQMGNASVVIS